jgi:hypothetical protein
MNRVTVINDLIKKHQYTSYLEIGVHYKSVCFNKIYCENKVSVDPGKRDQYDFNMTSDEFFNINKSTFDIIFVDGLHTADQCYKDILNSLDILNNNGTIVIHDTNPPTEFHATDKQYTKEQNIVAGNAWNGSVWKSIFMLRKTRSDIIMFTYPFDWGVTIIQKGSSLLLDVENDFFSFNIFDKHREKILNIIHEYPYNI